MWMTRPTCHPTSLRCCTPMNTLRSLGPRRASLPKWRVLTAEHDQLQFCVNFLRGMASSRNRRLVISPNHSSVKTCHRICSSICGDRRHLRQHQPRSIVSFDGFLRKCGTTSSERKVFVHDSNEVEKLDSVWKDRWRAHLAHKKKDGS